MDIRIAEAATIIGVATNRLRRWIQNGLIATTATDPFMTIDHTVAVELRDLIAVHDGNVEQAILAYKFSRQAHIRVHQAAKLIGMSRLTVARWCARSLVPSAVAAGDSDYLIPAEQVAAWIHAKAQYPTSPTEAKLNLRTPALQRLVQIHWLRCDSLPSGRVYYNRTDVDLLASAIRRWSRFQVFSIIDAPPGVLLALGASQDETPPGISAGDQAEATRLRKRRDPELIQALFQHRRGIIAEATDLG